jgi:hypothetical protein
MIPTATAQHLGKHFDLLLARELALIEREHKQKLIIHKKLENSIRRDNYQSTNSNRKKISISIEEPFHKHNEKSRSSITSTHSNNSRNQIDEILPQMFPRYHRYCFKAQRLPPIVKLKRPKRTNNDSHWPNIQKENIHEALTLLDEDEELPKVSLPELTPIQKQIRAFLDTLPIYKGVQKGFDNFAAGSIYSFRAPVAMR